MNKFYAVFDIDRIEDDIVVVGVFSKIDDAEEFSRGCEIRSVQHLKMDQILRVMLRTRLNLASDKISKLID